MEAEVFPIERRRFARRCRGRWSIIIIKAEILKGSEERGGTAFSLQGWTIILCVGLARGLFASHRILVDITGG